MNATTYGSAAKSVSLPGKIGTYLDTTSFVSTIQADGKIYIGSLVKVTFENGTLNGAASASVTPVWTNPAGTEVTGSAVTVANNAEAVMYFVKGVKLPLTASAANKDLIAKTGDPVVTTPIAEVNAPGAVATGNYVVSETVVIGTLNAVATTTTLLVTDFSYGGTADKLGGATFTVTGFDFTDAGVTWEGVDAPATTDVENKAYDVTITGVAVAEDYVIHNLVLITASAEDTQEASVAFELQADGTYTFTLTITPKA